METPVYDVIFKYNTFDETSANQNSENSDINCNYNNCFELLLAESPESIKQSLLTFPPPLLNSAETETETSEIKTKTKTKNNHIMQSTPAKIENFSVPYYNLFITYKKIILIIILIILIITLVFLYKLN